jgi:hypothetical protein
LQSSQLKDSQKSIHLRNRWSELSFSLSPNGLIISHKFSFSVAQPFQAVQKPAQARKPVPPKHLLNQVLHDLWVMLSLAGEREFLLSRLGLHWWRRLHF